MTPETHELNGRRMRFGRVVPFRVVIRDESGWPDVERRIAKLEEKHFYAEKGLLKQEGFGHTLMMDGVLCTRYVEGREKTTIRFDEAVIAQEEVTTPVYDLADTEKGGYILIGSKDEDVAVGYLNLYLEAIEITPESTIIEAMSVTPSVLKDIFENPKVSRRGVKATADSAVINFFTKLPDTDQDHYFQALKDEGLSNEPWESILIRPRYAVAGQRTPPQIRIYTTGFTMKTTILDPATWEYARRVLQLLEVSTRRQALVRPRIRMLEEFDVPEAVSKSDEKSQEVSGG